MYTFIKKDNHKFKKAKGINKNVIDNELKHIDYKNFLFNNRSSMRHEMNRIQSKFPCRLKMIKNIYLKMDIVGYQVFINLFVEHIKNYFVKYRQFVLIFTLVRTVILLSFFHPKTIY